jgi:AraC-like DNA-binding protein
MTFNFTATPDFDFMTSFAQHIHMTVHDGVLEIPENLGQGYIRKLMFGPDFKITIHHYVLNEDLIIKRNPSGLGNDLITVFFYSNEQSLRIAFNNTPQVMFSERDNSAIQVTSNDLSSSIRFPAHERIHYMVVAIKPSRLKELIAFDTPNSTLQAISASGSSFLYFENMAAETKLLLKNLISVNLKGTLSNFYIQIKVQELLYHVFYTLSLRENSDQQAINSADAARLLYIRNEILRDLSQPPVLKELSQLAAMSETKLKQLFKQTFGTTIYTYFQQARMEEAAFLLKKGKRSVAEVGYEMGFSNLSHFSRLFEKHYGLNPKRFSYS